MNASAVEPLSGKSDGIATQEIVDEKSRSEGASSATITDADQDKSVIDVQQIHVLDDVDTVVPNIADPATWPLIRNSKIIDHIIKTAMGTKLSDETSTSSAAFAYKKALHDLGIRFTERLSNVYYHFNFIFSFSKIAKEQKKNLDIVHSFTKSIISKRKQYIEKYGSNFNEDNVGDNDDDDVYFKSKKKPAMLDLLLSAQNKGLIDNDGIQEEVDTFVFEGHDTTAAALLFSLLCLANDKEIQTRIFTELDEIFGDSTRPPTMNDLSKMHYLDCCILETLRLYPPVHFIGRKLGESVTLSNYYVEKGTNVLIFIIDMHRREDLFKDALKYNPDRFLPENSAGRHPFAFIPFSAGLRNCIGQKFGMMEMKTCLSAILRRYRLEPVTRHEDVKFIPDLVLRAKPIYVKFFKRDK
ncbi:unnamed protein product [Diatraea saccharalis]|uniref:Cytochrome P450 n=1 Tax=Diatraea saccharalis TaxID=40085 RepID=A0A9N9RGS8_9NEOP|nr:unnamed protein product [Diatraea saccharalis]